MGLLVVPWCPCWPGPARAGTTAGQTTATGSMIDPVSQRHARGAANMDSQVTHDLPHGGVTTDEDVGPDAPAPLS